MGLTCPMCGGPTYPGDKIVWHNGKAIHESIVLHTLKTGKDTYPITCFLAYLAGYEHEVAGCLCMKTEVAK